MLPTPIPLLPASAATTQLRCLKNEFTKEYLAKEVAGAPQQELNDFATGTNRMGAVDGDIEHGAVLVGQSLNALKRNSALQGSYGKN